MPDIGLRGEKRKSSVGVVTSVIEGIHFGVELPRVHTIEDFTTIQEWQLGRPSTDDLAEIIDIAELWGFRRPEDDSLRRIVVVYTQAGLRQIVVGERVKVVLVPEGSLREVPPFLEGVAGRAAIRCLFVAEPHIGYLLDVDRIECVAEESCP